MNYLAQISNPALPDSFKDLSGVSFLQSALPAFIGIVLVIGVLVFFFVLITGAIGWITAGGDKARLEVARGRITSAIIGLVILFATFALVGFMEDFFSINIFELDFGPLKISP